MAELDSWASIRAHGLLSTSAIMELLEVADDRRRALVECHRPNKVTVAHAQLGSMVLRDQKPMNDKRLAGCLLDGLTPADWYRLLNGKVFFWVSEERLHTLLGARAYRAEEHDVLVLESERLIRRYEQAISLTHMNTGNTFPFPHRRGTETFKAIAEYPTARDGRTPRPEVVELVVDRAVPDVARYVMEVRRMRGNIVVEQIFP